MARVLTRFITNVARRQLPVTPVAARNYCYRKCIFSQNIKSKKNFPVQMDNVEISHTISMPSGVRVT